jgi:hypothetical protein
MSCLYYSKDLQKPVPCTIVPNVITIYNNLYTRDHICKVEYDETSLNTYNLTMNQILKYCSNYVNIHELYPYETQDEIDYFNNHAGISKIVYPDKELARYNKLYSYISNISEISNDIFFYLCSLFVVDLQFKYLTYEERIFMKSLSDSQFSQSPEIILVPEAIKMLLNLFDKYNGDINILMDDQKNNNFNYNLKYNITDLNPINIKYNMNLIRNENPNLFI